MSFKDWVTDRSRPSYGNQPQVEKLSENFWSAGQQSLFIKQLEDRNFKNHEIRYIRTRARPDNDEIVEKMLS